MLAVPSTEERVARTHADSGPVASLSAVGNCVAAAATHLGHRAEANNIVPGRSQLGQGSHGCSQHVQVVLHFRAS